VPNDLVVAGISLAGFVVLVVQALKVSGVTDAAWLGRTPWITAGVFLALKSLEHFLPASAPYIAYALDAVVGAAGAILGYFYALKPLAHRFGAVVTATDIEEGE